MKKIGFYNFYTIYNNNRMFNPEIQAPIGDDLLYPFHYLARVARQLGLSVSTIDTEPLDSYDAIIFLDYPGPHNRYLKKLIDMKFENLFLFIFENEIIKPDNWKKENYRHFKKVYTWRDDIVDNKNIFKFFLPNRIPNSISFDIYEKKKFCCLIAGNKKNHHPLELYSERIRAIRWFEKNQPEKFDLFGKGWDLTLPHYLAPFKPFFKPFYNLFFQPYSSYRGEITAKNDILKQYKFSICYENARDIPGYITEKIFDCFFAGGIPIYLGASNVNEYIPESCFIDKRKFSSYSDLFDHLNQMSEDDFLNYLHAIEEFMGSEKLLPFGAEYFATLILNELDPENLKKV
jgi:alpha(1,3/1,4) fucosyltransferase